VSDQLLGALKICLLVLLYLFFARVLWAVWSEVRTAKVQATDSRAAAPARAAAASRAAAATAEGTQPTERPVTKGSKRDPRDKREVRPTRGSVTRVVIIEPRSMKGVGYPLGDEITLGRADGCTISLTDDAYLSGLHARVYRQGTDAFVEDLSSTNGSFLNGTRLSAAAALSKGDRLQIGNTVLEAE
jgi:hypothetical protein